VQKEKTLSQWLYGLGEEKLTQFAKEVMANRRFAESLGKAFARAAKTKGQVDRNIDTLLGFLNIPSKADYSKLLAKVEAVQGSLVNLNIKLDRLLAAQKKPRSSPRSR
jgi:hypothetical protein